MMEHEHAARLPVRLNMKPACFGKMCPSTMVGKLAMPATQPCLPVMKLVEHISIIDLASLILYIVSAYSALKKADKINPVPQLLPIYPHYRIAFQLIARNQQVNHLNEQPKQPSLPGNIFPFSGGCLQARGWISHFYGWKTHSVWSAGS